jgi:hypothetical protein
MDDTIWQLKLEGIKVDEEQTINDPELLMEVILFCIQTCSVSMSERNVIFMINVSFSK